MYNTILTSAGSGKSISRDCDEDDDEDEDEDEDDLTPTTIPSIIPDNEEYNAADRGETFGFIKFNEFNPPESNIDIDSSLENNKIYDFNINISLITAIVSCTVIALVSANLSVYYMAIIAILILGVINTCLDLG